MSIEGWKTVTIKDCCDILDNKRIPINAEEREKRVGSIPYYGANGLQGYINDYIFDEDLILIAEDGGYFNEFATRPIAYKVSGKSWVNNHAHVLKSKAGYCQDIIFYCLEHKDIQPFIVGGTRSKLNQSGLRSIALDIPELESEQNQIAAILSTIDLAIEQTEAIIAKQQRIKTGLMQDLLTKGIDEDGNVRSEATHEFWDSPLGRIPVEWKIKATQDFCSEIVDCPHSTPAYGPAGIPCIRTADMVPGQLLLNTAWRVSEKIYEERILRLEPRKGDIIYSREGERLGIASPVGEERVCLGQRVMLLRPDTDTDSTYFLWSMNADDYYRRAIKGLGATTSPHINVKDIKLTPMRCPPPQEQKTIGKVLAQHHYDYAANLNMLSKLSRLQMGLMQDLLTGNVRVTALLNDRANTSL